MSYLKLAKQAEARLRAAKTAVPDDIDDRTTEASGFGRNIVNVVSPDTVRQRVAAFTRQLDDWIRTGRAGVPFLTLPDVEPSEGACLSCGDMTAQGQACRCAPCERAIAEVIGIPDSASCGLCGALGSRAWLTTTDKGCLCPACTLREYGPHV